MSVLYPLPTMMRQLSEAGYAQFRLDAPTPPGMQEEPASLSIFDRPLDVAIGDDEAGGDGPSEDPAGRPDVPPPDSNVLTDELIAVAHVMPEDWFLALAGKAANADLQTRASYERTRLEREYNWGYEPLLPATVRRYRKDAVFKQHLRIRLAFGPDRGDSAPTLRRVSEAYVRLAGLLRTEQQRRLEFTHSQQDTVGGDVINRMAMGLKFLELLGVDRIEHVAQAAGIPLRDVHRRLPVLRRWLSGRPSLLQRRRMATHDPEERYENLSFDTIVRAGTNFLRPFGFRLRSSPLYFRLALDNLSFWQLAHVAAPDESDQRPAVGFCPATMPCVISLEDET